MKGFNVTFTIVLVLFLVGDIAAQEVYYAAVKTIGGKKAIGGFLYKVDDSTLYLVQGAAKKDIKFINQKEPIPIRINLIKKIGLTRIRSTGRNMLEAAGISFVISTAAFSSLNVTPRTYLPIFVLSVTSSLIVHNLLRVRTYSPTDHFFREKMEERCIVKDERSLASNQ